MPRKNRGDMTPASSQANETEPTPESVDNSPVIEPKEGNAPAVVPTTPNGYLLPSGTHRKDN